MKAMRLHDPGPIEETPLVAEDVPEPVPAADEILVRVSVCGVCRTDLHEIEGDLPLRKTPIVPGHQVVGTVARCGVNTPRFAVGDRIGVAWLHRACGGCEFCSRGPHRENLCRRADFTGWSVDGGYTEYVTVPQDFAYRIPDGFADEHAAPLLCAGIIGHRALRLCAVESGQRLGLFGFGASAHIAIQVAINTGRQVFVFTRSKANRALARKLGASWVGGPDDAPPDSLHGAIIFAPAGRLVTTALALLQEGGTVALAGIHMSDVPPLDYREHLYDEKVLRSVANATRQDGRELLDLAARIPIRTSVTAFPLEDANEALLAVKHGRVSGAAILDCSSPR